MKIKAKEKEYEEVLSIKMPEHKKPMRPSFLLRSAINILAHFSLKKSGFKINGSLPPKSEGPCLVFMNHSSFIDLEIAEKVMYPRPVNIVCSYDALVGKEGLMRRIGCIPTRKFVSDITLIKDMKYALKKGWNVLMYPEAGYSFDGTATTIQKQAKLIKLLGVPVVMIKTEGAFTKDPLYNGLRTRDVPVSANIFTIVSKEEINTLSEEEIDARVDEAFTFDAFKWQRENKISVKTPDRAVGLDKTLYMCPHCKAEGYMKSSGEKIRCFRCRKSYTLGEYGDISADVGETEFSHIPDWYNWQREVVREQILAGKYFLDIPVRISMMNDFKVLYKVGKGRLIHNATGFKLTGCDGKLDYKQKALFSHTVNSDFFWYELGDIVSIGDNRALYYLFPVKRIPVAKIRLAAEELYKLHQNREFHKKYCSDCLFGKKICCSE